MNTSGYSMQIPCMCPLPTAPSSSSVDASFYEGKSSRLGLSPQHCKVKLQGDNLVEIKQAELASKHHDAPRTVTRPTSKTVRKTAPELPKKSPVEPKKTLTSYEGIVLTTRAERRGRAVRGAKASKRTSQTREQLNGNNGSWSNSDDVDRTTPDEHGVGSPVKGKSLVHLALCALAASPQ